MQRDQRFGRSTCGFAGAVVVLCALSVFALMPTSGVTTTSSSTHGEGAPAPVSCKQCSNIYTAAISDAFPVNGSRPIMSQVDATWISAILRHAAQKRTLLVYGLGRDSRMWCHVNCGHRTVFLEDDAGWVEFVQRGLLDMEVYTLNYTTRMADADAFFAKPYLPRYPKEVASACFQVIVVDAPKGFDTNQPGRLQPAAYATQRSACCIKDGAFQTAFVFMHDMERPLEQRIAAEYFSKAYGWEPVGSFATQHTRPPHAKVMSGWTMTSESLAAATKTLNLPLPV